MFWWRSVRRISPDLEDHVVRIPSLTILDEQDRLNHPQLLVMAQLSLVDEQREDGRTAGRVLGALTVLAIPNHHVEVFLCWQRQDPLEREREAVRSSLEQP